jgi:predicted small metal-binding protein
VKSKKNEVKMQYLKCQDLGIKKCRCVISGNTQLNVVNSTIKHIKKTHPDFLKNMNYQKIFKLRKEIRKNIL